MADLTCPHCNVAADPADMLCVACGGVLVGAAPARGREPERPRCPSCATVVSELEDHCPNCLEHLSARPVRLTLRFPGGVIHVREGERVVLGRDPAVSPHADLFAAHDNVSRKHAAVWLERGVARVVDEGSTNGTFVNGRALDDEPCELPDAGVLRLAADVELTVHLQR